MNGDPNVPGIEARKSERSASRQPRIALTLAGIILIVAGIALFSWLEARKGAIDRSLATDAKRAQQEADSQREQARQNLENAQFGRPTVTATPTFVTGIRMGPDPSEEFDLLKYATAGGFLLICGGVTLLILSVRRPR